MGYTPGELGNLLEDFRKRCGDSSVENISHLRSS